MEIPKKEILKLFKKMLYSANAQILHSFLEIRKKFPEIFDSNIDNEIFDRIQWMERDYSM